MSSTEDRTRTVKQWILKGKSNKKKNNQNNCPVFGNSSLTHSLDYVATNLSLAPKIRQRSSTFRVDCSTLPVPLVVSVSRTVCLVRWMSTLTFLPCSPSAFNTIVTFPFPLSLSFASNDVRGFISDNDDTTRDVYRDQKSSSLSLSPFQSHNIKENESHIDDARCEAHKFVCLIFPRPPVPSFSFAYSVSLYF